MSKAAPSGTADAAASDEVLDKVRIPFIHRAALLRPQGEEPLFLVDLALTGAFAERAEPLPSGERVKLRFRLPGNEIPLVVGCRVAWSNPKGGRLVTKALPAGLGLEFVDMSALDQARLRAYLSDYLKGGLRRFHRPWPPQSGESDP
jgi:Tfp pilus assembly protein PilZ